MLVTESLLGTIRYLSIELEDEFENLLTAFQADLTFPDESGIDLAYCKG